MHYRMIASWFDIKPQFPLSMRDRSFGSEYCAILIICASAGCQFPGISTLGGNCCLPDTLVDATAAAWIIQIGTSPKIRGVKERWISQSNTAYSEITNRKRSVWLPGSRKPSASTPASSKGAEASLTSGSTAIWSIQSRKPTVAVSRTRPHSSINSATARVLSNR